MSRWQPKYDCIMCTCQKTKMYSHWQHELIQPKIRTQIINLKLITPCAETCIKQQGRMAWIRTQTHNVLVNTGRPQLCLYINALSRSLRHRLVSCLWDYRRSIRQPKCSWRRQNRSSTLKFRLVRLPLNLNLNTLMIKTYFYLSRIL